MLAGMRLPAPGCGGLLAPRCLPPAVKPFRPRTGAFLPKSPGFQAGWEGAWASSDPAWHLWSHGDTARSEEAQGPKRTRAWVLGAASTSHAMFSPIFPWFLLAAWPQLLPKASRNRSSRFSERRLRWQLPRSLTQREKVQLIPVPVGLAPPHDALPHFPANTTA